MSRKLLEIALGALSPSLKIDSSTESSAEVVAKPQKAIQSLTHIPAPINSELENRSYYEIPKKPNPLLTVPATTGT